MNTKVQPKPAETSSTGYPRLVLHPVKVAGTQRSVQAMTPALPRAPVAKSATSGSKSVGGGRSDAVPSPGKRAALPENDPELPPPPAGYVGREGFLECRAYGSGVDDEVPPPPTDEDDVPPPPADEDEVPPPPADEDDVPPPPMDEDEVPAPPPMDSEVFFECVQGVKTDIQAHRAGEPDVFVRTLDPQIRHLDRVHKAGNHFLDEVCKWQQPAFDASHSALLAARIVATGESLGAYVKLQGARERGAGEASELPIANLVENTRLAIAPALENLLASDEFAMGTLDVDQLNSLAAALTTLGIPLDRLDDKMASAKRELAGTRPRLIDNEAHAHSADALMPVRTRAEFIKEVRAPIRDITFLGFTIRRRDTAYQEVLKSVDAYHAAAKGKPARAAEAETVRMAFEKMKYSAEGYIADMRNNESDRNAMRAQVLPLQRELAVLDRAIWKIKGSPDNLPADLQTVCTRERAAASEIFRMVRGPGSAFTELNAQGAVRHGLTRELAQNCATRAPERTAGMKPLGKGAINTVYLAEVKLPASGTFAGVYKKNSESVDSASLAAGISKDRPTSALRNLATWKLNQRLQLDVIPPTHLVLNGDQLGCILERARGVSPLHTGNRQLTVSAEAAQRLRDDPGLLESFAMQKGYFGATIEGDNVNLILERTNEGMDGSVVRTAGDSQNPVDFNSSVLRRELTKLQWLDALTGQCDRHAHNYFVEHDSAGGVHVRGIDNDMAFGSGLDDPDKRPGGHSPKLPNVIDRHTANLLRSLTPKQLQEDCAGLAADEIASATKRLTVIQKRIEEFEKDPPAGRVLETDADWSATETSALLGVASFDHIKQRLEGGDQRAMNRAVDAAFDISYVSRDHATQVEARKGFSAMPLLDPAEFENLGVPQPGDAEVQAMRASA